MRLEGHDQWITGIAFSSNGKYLFSSSDDKSVRIWDLVNNGVCFKTFNNLHNTFISCLTMNSKLMVTGDVDKLIKIWEIR